MAQISYCFLRKATAKPGVETYFMLVSPWPRLLNLLRQEDQEELRQEKEVPAEKGDKAWNGFLRSFLQLLPNHPGCAHPMEQ